MLEYELVVDPIGPSLLTGSGTTDPFDPPVHRTIRQFGGIMVMAAPLDVSVPDDHRLGLAMAAYREGVGASSPWLGFFAFWNAIEAVYDGDEQAVNTHLTQEAASGPDVLAEYVRRVLPPNANWEADDDVGRWLREHRRNAIAHLIRDREDRTQIDPDSPRDRIRLAAEGWWLRAVARRAILMEWPDAVALTHSSA